MALDGLVVANLVYELNQKIQDGRIQKIAQPEKDELLLTVKKERKNYKLMVSAGAALGGDGYAGGCALASETLGSILVRH